jgi:1,4-alpha-glucan branching enzyme
VSIVGDWNGWDPFVDHLRETEPGRYSISLRVRPGRHWYYFLADGQRVLDVANPATGRDPEGRQVSYFSLPSE